MIVVRIFNCESAFIGLMQAGRFDGIGSHNRGQQKFQISAAESAAASCQCQGGRLVAHQVTVSCMRYLVEQLDEATILTIDRQGEIPGAALIGPRAIPAVMRTL
jgi:hypothetical protein